MLRRSCFRFNIKPVMTADQAVADIKSGMTLTVGGFGAGGSPHALCTALCKRKHEVRDLKLYTNSGSITGYGIGLLFEHKQVSRVACSHFGSNSFAERQYLDGELEIEFTPQGSLVERMRAGGAGIPAFFTPTAAGTILQEGGIPAKYCPRQQCVKAVAPPKETRIFDGKVYVMEEAIHSDYALVKAQKVDKYGNACFVGTSRNFNIPCATAAKTCILEAQEMVDYLHPDEVHMPGIYVDRVVIEKYKTFIEEPSHKDKHHHKHHKHHHHAERPPAGASKYAPPPQTQEEKISLLQDMSVRKRMQRRAALEVQPETNVNLGIGLPTGVPHFVQKAVMHSTMLQTENGLLGMGPAPEGEPDGRWIDAGKQPVTPVPGASTFSSDVSFGMIRGGKLDLTILGALQVAENGDLANWLVPGKMSAGPGGAMDLLCGCRRVVIVMTHVDKTGKPKLLKECLLPLTSQACVNRVITEKAVFDFDHVTRKMILKEIAPDSSLEEVKSLTEARFELAEDLKEMPYSWERLEW